MNWNIFKSDYVSQSSSAGRGSPQGDVLENVQNTPCLEAVLLCLPAVLVTNETTTCGLITPQVFIV